MQAVQTIGVDLPLKALVWLRPGDTWLSNNDPAWLAKRHGLSRLDTPIGNLIAALDSVAKAATAG
jgi:uncharacterized protein (DUF302 family)